MTAHSYRYTQRNDPPPRSRALSRQRWPGHGDLVHHLHVQVRGFPGRGSCVLLKVFDEEPGQVFLLLVVFLEVRPIAGGVQLPGGHAGTGNGDLKIEYRKGFVLCLQELSVVYGVDDRAGVGQRHAVSDAIGTPGPPCVHEPGGGAVLRHLLCQ
eukprot:scaffold116_cov334-Pavlova_lutheri.AAC.75